MITFGLIGVAAVVSLVIVVEALRRPIRSTVFSLLFVGSTLIGVLPLARTSQTLIAADALIAAAALAVACRSVLVGVSSPRWRLSPLVAWPTLIAVLGGLFLVGSRRPSASAVQVGAFLLLGLYSYVGRRVDAARVDLASTLSLTFVVHGSVALWQLLHGSGGRITGAFLLPNQFGMFLVLAAPVMLDRAWKTRTASSVLSLAVIVPLLISTGSRSCLLGAVVACSLYTVLLWRQHLRRAVLARRVVMAVFIVICVMPVGLMLSQRALDQWRVGGGLSFFARERNGGERPLAFHETNWRDGLASFKRSPIYGSAFDPNLSHEEGATFEIHDNYIAMLGELGVFGLASLALLVACLARAWRRARHRTDLQALVLGISGVLLVVGIFNLSLRQRFVWIAVGYLEAALRTAQVPAGQLAAGALVGAQGSDDR